MNKAVFALVLVGLVVLATMVEGKRYSSKDKLRMKKDKLMRKDIAKGVDKVKGAKRMLEKAGGKHAGRRRDEISRGYAALKQELVNKKITQEQFKEKARELKDQAKREKAAGQYRQKAAEKGRNKRSIKQEATKKRRASKLNTVAEKSRKQ